MAKNYDFNKAKDLYESFTAEEKSLREIEAASGVPEATIRHRAKKEDWQRGRVAHLKADVARVSKNLAQERATLRNTITDEVDKLLEAQGLHHDGSIMLAKMAIKFASKEGTTKGVLAASQALTNTAKLTGIQPFYPNATNINTTATSTAEANSEIKIKFV